MVNSKRRPLKKVNVLFTCIGRRVSLLQSFSQAAKKAGLKFCGLGTDKTELSPAFQLCDKSFIVQPTTSPGYLNDLLRIVKDNKVDLLVPTVDLDLKVLAKNKSRFEKLGCVVLVSSPEVVEICQDKRKTYRFLCANGFDTPLTMSVKTALSKKKMSWPCFLKPWDGYASRGNAVAHNRRELLFYGKRVPNAIVQEYVEGDEFTCDVFVDPDMQVRCVVPRRRIEVRGGEVSKSQVVKNTVIMSKAAELVEKLGAGPGVITLQLFLNGLGRMRFIEINPRFGGGAPLSIKAGADFPRWLLESVAGRKPAIKFDGFKDNLTMLRYDAEVWLERK